MIHILIANQEQHAQPIRELFWEYLQWPNGQVKENFGVSFDIATMLEEDMHTVAHDAIHLAQISRQLNQG